MEGAAGPVVVKLGGSYAFSAHLRDWIASLATCAGRVVIVPGGGPFADAVRSAQRKIGFDDAAAHHMAILAMEQYGRALVSLNGLLAAADSANLIRRELLAGRVPVWMPARMALSAAEIAQSWDTTSDSLAAWLAGKIGAPRLFLVKRIVLRSGQAHAEALAAKGIIDKEFARHLRASGTAAFLFGPRQHEAAISAIRDATAAGTPVE